MKHTRMILTMLVLTSAVPTLVWASEASVLTMEINRYFGELLRATNYASQGQKQIAQETYERAQKHLAAIKKQIAEVQDKNKLFDLVRAKLPRINTTAAGAATVGFADWIAAEELALVQNISAKSPTSSHVRTVSSAAPMSPRAAQGPMSPTRRMTASEQGGVRMPGSPTAHVRPTSPSSAERAMSPSRKAPGRKVTFADPEVDEKRAAAERAVSPSGRRMPPPPPTPARTRATSTTGTGV